MRLLDNTRSNNQHSSDAADKLPLSTWPSYVSSYGVDSALSVVDCSTKRNRAQRPGPYETSREGISYVWSSFLCSSLRFRAALGF